MTATARLEMRNIGKEYYGNRVLKGVSFTLGTGKVLSLVGENGAGKSTIIKIITGVYTRDAEIYTWMASS